MQSRSRPPQVPDFLPEESLGRSLKRREKGNVCVEEGGREGGCGGGGGGGMAWMKEIMWG